MSLLSALRARRRATKAGRIPRAALIVSLLLTVITHSPLLSAQSFSESFNDITTLAGSGWVITNNSTPVGSLGWFQGTATTATPTPGPFNSFNGAANAYIAANFNSTGSTGTISNWLIMPNRTLKNGDVLTFYTRKPTIGGGQTDYPDRLEIRMSTNGASTNVGTGATGLGDFSTLLLSINPTLVANVYPQVWSQYTVTISGLPAPTSGRFAFRYFVTGAGSLGSNSDYIGIDQVDYTPYTCPAVSVTPTSLASSLIRGQAASIALSSSGNLGAANFTVTAGALPAGLTLSAGGVISGTPTFAGTFNFTVTANDASGCSGSQAYSLTVDVPDTDNDGVNDDDDICPTDATDNCLDNPYGDFDADGVVNSADLCPADAQNNCLANPDGDFDGDGISNTTDACPEDATNACPAGDLDNDGVNNGDDICPLDAQNNCLANPDGDFDGDGIANGVDTCPEDATGACPAGDLDGDGINNGADACPTDPTNACYDGDLDSDGVINGEDICPTDPADNCVENPVADTDGDGIANGLDNCPALANTDQLDTDDDGQGDACDDDTDGDGVPNDSDDYPLDPDRYLDPADQGREGDAAKQAYGRVLHNLGDINGDYADDYAVGTPNYTATATVNGKTKKLAKAGKVDVFSGRDGSLLWQKTGTAKGQLFGSAISAASLWGNEYVDIAIGAPGANKKTGEVHVCWFDIVDGEIDCVESVVLAPDATFKGSLFGSSVAVAENIGVFVGAPSAKNTAAGNLTVGAELLNKKVGAVLFYAKDELEEASLSMFGSALNGEFGASLQWLPQDELIAIGAPRANKTGEVAVWGGESGITALASGSATGEGFGRVLALGSMEEGVEHLAIAAPLAANGKLKQAGRVDVFAVIEEGLSKVQSYVGGSKGEQLGASLAFAAAERDGADSLFAGSPNFTVPKSGSSKALAKAGKVSRFELAEAESQGEVVGTQAKQAFGTSLAALDLTGDFIRDLIVGSTGANSSVNPKLKAVGSVELHETANW